MIFICCQRCRDFLYGLYPYDEEDYHNAMTQVHAVEEFEKEHGELSLVADYPTKPQGVDSVKAFDMPCRLCCSSIASCIIRVHFKPPSYTINLIMNDDTVNTFTVSCCCPIDWVVERYTPEEYKDFTYYSN